MVRMAENLEILLEPGVVIVGASEEPGKANLMGKNEFSSWMRNKSPAAAAYGCPANLEQFSLLAKVNGADSYGRGDGSKKVVFIYERGGFEYVQVPQEKMPGYVPKAILVKIG